MHIENSYHKEKFYHLFYVITVRHFKSEACNPITFYLTVLFIFCLSSLPLQILLFVLSSFIPHLCLGNLNFNSWMYLDVFPVFYLDVASAVGTTWWRPQLWETLVLVFTMKALSPFWEWLLCSMAMAFLDCLSPTDLPLLGFSGEGIP